MPKQSYALEKGGPKRLELSWGAFWKNLTIKLDGNEIGTIADPKDLRAGQAFTLPDGSTLHVQLVQKFGSGGLHILHDGEPLPGSAGDPEARLRGAYIAVFFVGGLNALLGLLGIVLESEFLENLGVGVPMLIFGAILLVLGYFVTRRSLIALIAAIVIYAADAFVGLYLMVEAGESANFAWIAFRILLIVLMAQGIPAIRELKADPTA